MSAEAKMLYLLPALKNYQVQVVHESQAKAWTKSRNTPDIRLRYCMWFKILVTRAAPLFDGDHQAAS